MVWHGHIEKGTVVVDGHDTLPDSGRVRIELLSETAEAECGPAKSSLGALLLELAGQAKGLPTDAAARHDDSFSHQESL